MKKIIWTLSVILALFGLFIAYQILLKILGHSWSLENVIVTLLMFNLSISITLGLSLFGLRSDHKHLSKQFNALASDFKGHVKKK